MNYGSMNIFDEVRELKILELAELNLIKNLAISIWL